MNNITKATSYVVYSPWNIASRAWRMLSRMEGQSSFLTNAMYSTYNVPAQDKTSTFL